MPGMSSNTAGAFCYCAAYRSPVILTRRRDCSTAASARILARSCRRTPKATCSVMSSIAAMPNIAAAATSAATRPEPTSNFIPTWLTLSGSFACARRKKAGRASSSVRQRSGYDWVHARRESYGSPTHPMATGSTPDAAVQVRHDVVWRVEGLPLEIISDELQRPVMLPTHDATVEVLAGELATLEIDGIAVSVVRRAAECSDPAILPD